VDIHNLAAPAPIAWFWDHTWQEIWLLTFVCLPLPMFLLANVYHRQLAVLTWRLSTYHNFTWGIGICVPTALATSRAIADHWEGGTDAWYVSRRWFVAWMVAGPVVTVLNAFNDRRNATDWSDVVGYPYAKYHIAAIVVFVTLGGSIAGVVLSTVLHGHAPIWLDALLLISYGGYVASILLDAVWKESVKRSGGILGNSYWPSSTG
jgi:hypothetical protein